MLVEVAQDLWNTIFHVLHMAKKKAALVFASRFLRCFNKHREAALKVAPNEGQEKRLLCEIEHRILKILPRKKFNNQEITVKSFAQLNDWHTED